MRPESLLNELAIEGGSLIAAIRASPSDDAACMPGLENSPSPRKTPTARSRREWGQRAGGQRRQPVT
jgi:hypothetical protein